MFELNLSEMFSIVGVGISVSILIAYFYFLFCKLFIISIYNKNAFLRWLKINLKRDYSKTGYALVMLVLVYSLGVLTLDITDYMTDSVESTNPVVRFFQKADIVERESDLRRKVLIKNEHQLTGLGKEVLSNPYIIVNTKKAGNNNTLFTSNANEYWTQNGDSILRSEQNQKSLNSLVNQIYYEAKNWCFLYSTPVKEELKSIQHHNDFSRSIYLISLITFSFVFIMFIVYLIKELFRGKNKFTIRIEGENKKMFFFSRLSLIILIPIIFISKECYYAAETNFNERAFGYYVSYLDFVNNENNKGNNNLNEKLKPEQLQAKNLKEQPFVLGLK